MISDERFSRVPAAPPSLKTAAPLANGLPEAAGTLRRDSQVPVQIDSCRGWRDTRASLVEARLKEAEQTVDRRRAHAAPRHTHTVENRASEVAPIQELREEW